MSMENLRMNLWDKKFEAQRRFRKGHFTPYGPTFGRYGGLGIHFSKPHRKKTIGN